MNVNEGMRRLALLLGAVGAVLGGFVSYTLLSGALHQIARHNAFERLAHSSVVEQARAHWIAARIPPDYDALSRRFGGRTSVPMFDPKGTVREIPAEDVSKALAAGGEIAIRFKAPDGTERWVRESERDAAIKAGGVPDVPDYSDQQKLLAAIWRSLGAKERHEMLAEMNAEQAGALQALLDQEALQGSDWFAENAPLPPSEVDRGGIRAIHWNRDLAVDSIETEGGQTLYPAPEPSGRTYPLIVVLPVIGFVLPWGAIRAICWVGAGFGVR